MKVKVKVYPVGIPPNSDEFTFVAVMSNGNPYVIRIPDSDCAGNFATLETICDDFEKPIFIYSAGIYSGWIDPDQILEVRAKANESKKHIDLTEIKTKSAKNSEKYEKKDTKNLNADVRAAARGQIVIEPKPNELFIDIDNRFGLETFWKTVGWLEDLVTGYDIKPSKTKDHYHIVVRLNRDVKDAFERIGLQAILGSDNLREVLSWRNAVHQSGRPTCFFESK